MSLGPEYIRALSAEITSSTPALGRIGGVEGGESWLALRTALGALFFSWGGGHAGCCLADSDSVEFLRRSAPARSPMVEALRSRLVRGRIAAARQINDDRVLELEISRLVAAGFEVTYFLVLEATEPTGNLLLLNSSRVIEEAARHASPDVNKYRTLLPDHAYIPPPAFEGVSIRDIEQLSLETLASIKGIGRPLAHLIASRWSDQTPDEWLAALRLSVAGSPDCICQMTERGYMTCFPVLLRGAEAVVTPVTPNKGALAAAARGLITPLVDGARERVLRGVDVLARRAERSLLRRRDGLLNRLNSDAGSLREKGELLLAHAWEIQQGAEKVLLPSESGGVVEIALDPSLSPARNAERYFRKYKKARCDPEQVRADVTAIDQAIDEILEQGALLRSIEDVGKFEEAARDVEQWLTKDKQSESKSNSKSNSKSKSKSKSNKATPPPHLRFEVDGCTVLVGLSARGNRYVTFKEASGGDLWLHAREVPGAHVIVKGCSAGRPSSAVLDFAASLAARHSRAKDALTVRVDCTQRRHVRAVPGTVALVTYTDFETIVVRPLGV
ncbi:MAG: NFACT family protein [Synergistaceae bacterium]|jgi:predicted ribosome quality control (RQC) complex YloA/Tae2 family protein|nr:NFACT family protein [Synergistaceae bacterium]